MPATALADHLRLYCELGAPVFPLTGKQPLIPNGFKGASTDPAQVVEWWKRWPDANVGVATGHAFDVLDIDSPEAMAELGADALTPHDQPIVTTGRGWHVYYAITGTDYGKTTRARNRMAGHAGIDWKGLGGYVVAPPSIHPDTGKRYTFNHWTEPVIAPDFILEMLVSECPSMQSEGSERPDVAPVDRDDLRNEIIAQLHQQDYTGLVDFVRENPEGNRNHGLYWATRRLLETYDQGSDISEAWVQIQEAASDSGLSSHEIDTTMNSAQRGHEEGTNGH